MFKTNVSPLNLNPTKDNKYNNNNYNNGGVINSNDYQHMQGYHHQPTYQYNNRNNISKGVYGNISNNSNNIGNNYNNISNNVPLSPLSPNNISKNPLSPTTSKMKMFSNTLTLNNNNKKNSNTTAGITQ